MWSKSYSKEKPLEAEKTVDERYIIRRNIKEEVSGDGKKAIRVKNALLQTVNICLSSGLMKLS